MIKVFATFEAAQDAAAAEIRGWPAWRVEPLGPAWVVALVPGDVYWHCDKLEPGQQPRARRMWADLSTGGELLALGVVDGWKVSVGRCAAAADADSDSDGVLWLAQRGDDDVASAWTYDDLLGELRQLASEEQGT